MTDSAVLVRGLTKRYRDNLAVNNVDLNIAAGEIFALLGPNGAGKTTTVEILEGYRDRDGGEVEVLGADPQRAGRRWRYGIGIVLQDASDLSELTVRETVRHFARYYPNPRDPDQVIEQVGLAAKANSRVSTLSGGQRRRIDVAVGIVGNPALLFLDEPTTGFDPQARRQFWDLIRSLAQENGTTVLLTTHYLEEAENLADRVAVIVKGQVVAEGDPATLGGRAEAKATVSWLENGEHRTQEATDPGTLIAELTARHGGTVPGLTVSRPSLEDVYLDLIGSAQK
ncbi:ABC transporter ATP-binding protein [Polymorphospora rubra]|uniref:ABC transporter n=1 Tax=Polymorphospora rubra TaxID=338584 RepID=A0A810NDJ0_9ACTN|nr:ABC transporter ATP-binding protein [Polymorphospora rubra]BCJ69355.1 ABC transporter [Polymorphospora rubra]